MSLSRCVLSVALAVVALTGADALTYQPLNTRYPTSDVTCRSVGAATFCYRWPAGENNIQVEFKATINGWVAGGFNAQSYQMGGAKVVFGQQQTTSAQVLGEQFLTGQAYTKYNSLVADGDTTVQYVAYTVPVGTGTDFTITPSTTTAVARVNTNVIYARGSGTSPNFNQHSAADSDRLNTAHTFVQLGSPTGTAAPVYSSSTGTSAPSSSGTQAPTVTDVPQAQGANCQKLVPTVTYIDGDFNLCYTVNPNSNTIDVQLDSKTAAGGWLGLGLAKTAAEMNDATVVVGAGKTLVTTGYTANNNVRTGTNDAGVTNTKVTTSSDGLITMVSFTVPFASNSSYIAADGSAHLIWARGPAGLSNSFVPSHTEKNGNFGEFKFNFPPINSAPAKVNAAYQSLVALVGATLAAAVAYMAL